jgi:hypothetical protein
MKKSIYLLIASVFLLSSLVFADSASDIDMSMGIYFCTKDLRSLESSFVEAEKPIIKDGDIFVKSNLDDKDHTFLRHCFFIVADVNEMSSSAISDDTPTHPGQWLRLRNLDSAGYGLPVRGSKQGRVVSEEWLSDEEALTKFTVSCTPLLEESKLVKEELENCEKNGCDDITQEDIINGTKIRDIIWAKWENLCNAMRMIASQREYNLVSNNCCSVAYGGALNVGFNMSNISKRNFNICGMGISLDEYDRSLDISKGLLRSTTGATVGLFRYIEKFWSKKETDAYQLVMLTPEWAAFVENNRDYSEMKRPDSEKPIFMPADSGAVPIIVGFDHGNAGYSSPYDVNA